MANEILVDDATAILDADINNSVTSLDINTYSGLSALPGTGNFRLRIGDEIMLVTAVSGSTLTVTRAADGTTASSHTTGDAISFTLTRDGFIQLLNDRFPTSAYGSQPTFAFNGRLWLPTDGSAIYRDNGSGYDPYGPIFPLTTPPVLSNWTSVKAVNAGYTTNSGADSKGSLYLTGVNGDANGCHVSALVMAQPARPYSITAALLGTYQQTTNFGPGWGLCFYDGSSKFVGFMLYPSQVGGGGTQLYVAKYANVNSFSSTYVANNFHHTEACRFMRVTDNGTNFIFEVSADGQNFLTISTQTRTDYLTPSHVGWMCDSELNGFSVGATLLSWKQG